jgi:hypothetical protein
LVFLELEEKPKLEQPADDPIARLRGLGKQYWAGIDVDTFVDGLRSGWNDELEAEPSKASESKLGKKPGYGGSA